jgi:hypothetical protein
MHGDVEWTHLRRRDHRGDGQAEPDCRHDLAVTYDGVLWLHHDGYAVWLHRRLVDPVVYEYRRRHNCYTRWK